MQIAATALSAVSTMTQARSEAKAKTQEAEIAAKNTAKEVAVKAGALQSSFLSSGLSLEGTPGSAISNVFKTGLEDIDLIRSNANTQSKNIMSAASNKVMGDIMGTAGNIGLGGFDSMTGGRVTGSKSVINTITGGYTSSSGMTGGFDPKTGITWNSGRKF